MRADSILVIDAGTSALRAVGVGRDGAVTPVATGPWRIFVPDDGGDYAREFDADEIAESCGRLVEAAAESRANLAGIAVTGQREGLVFLDQQDAALFAAPNVDARAAAEGLAIDAAHGERVYETTGHLPSLMLAPARLAWLRANRPEIAARVARVMPLADWLASTLTGTPRISRTLAAEIGLLDVRTGTIADALLLELEMSPDLVPPLVEEGEVVGAVRDGALAGVPVVLAGADTQCGLVGSEALAPGDAAVVAGWSAPVQAVTSDAVIDAQRRTWTSVHSASGARILESNSGEAGRAWDWICAMFGVDVEAGGCLAASAPAGSGDVLAVLGPPAMNAAAMNVALGAITMPMPLVMSAPDRGHVLRAVLESIAYAIRANLGQIEEIAGTRTARLAAGGGLTRTPVFTRILADVLDRPVEVARAPETTALGAAVVAAPALGLHPSLEAAAGAMTAPRAVVEPELRVAALYDDAYARWRDLAAHLQAAP